MGPHRGTTALAWSLFALWAAISVATAVVGSGQPENRDYIFPLMLVGYATVRRPCGIAPSGERRGVAAPRGRR